MLCNWHLIKDGLTYLLVHDEDVPHLMTRHKKNIKKVMFICAVARPRHVGHTCWDGKIGIWPVGDVVEAADQCNMC